MTDWKQDLAAGAREIRAQVGDSFLVFVRIEPGEFSMGSKPTEAGRGDADLDQRRVRISKPFYISRYLVTQAQYIAITGSNESQFHGERLAMDDVRFAQGLQFCDKLAKSWRVKVALPTEAQWEYACRAGTATRFYSGDSEAELSQAAWYAGNSDEKIHEVGAKAPNAWGLYDMLGDVWELCADWIEDFRALRVVDPAGTVSETAGALRGGAWMEQADQCRCASRMLSNDMFGGSGLRLVVNP